MLRLIIIFSLFLLGACPGSISVKLFRLEIFLRRLIHIHLCFICDGICRCRWPKIVLILRFLCQLLILDLLLLLVLLLNLFFFIVYVCSGDLLTATVPFTGADGFPVYDWARMLRREGIFKLFQVVDPHRFDLFGSLLVEHLVRWSPIRVEYDDLYRGQGFFPFMISVSHVFTAISVERIGLDQLYILLTSFQLRLRRRFGRSLSVRSAIALINLICKFVCLPPWGGYQELVIHHLLQDSFMLEGGSHMIEELIYVATRCVVNHRLPALRLTSIREHPKLSRLQQRPLYLLLLFILRPLHQLFHALTHDKCLLLVHTTGDRFCFILHMVLNFIFFSAQFCAFHKRLLLRRFCLTVNNLRLVFIIDITSLLQYRYSRAALCNILNWCG